MNNKLSAKKTIIFVSGGPGTGKSYACKYIEKRIKHLSIVSYDEIKEKQWDRFGFDNVRQKEVLDSFSLEEFYLILQKLMWEEKTILTEYPFYQRHKGKLARIVEENDYKAVTIYLYADLKTIYERGIDRDANTDRHPGHLTNVYHSNMHDNPEILPAKKIMNYSEFEKSIREKQYDIQIGRTIKLDVTDIQKIDYESVVKQILL